MIENDYIERYIAKTGLVREKITPNPVLESKKIKIFCIFGELAATNLFAKVIYPLIVKDNNCYNIVVTWNGLRCFFDDADEVWSLNSSYDVHEFYKETYGIINESKNVNVILRSLNEHFLNVKNANEYKDFFSFYIKQAFFDTYKTSVVKFPDYLSHSYLSQVFLEKHKNSDGKNVAIMPIKYSLHWQEGKQYIFSHNEDLYCDLINAMVEKNYNVFCLQNNHCFDISRNIENKKLYFFKENDYQKIFSMVNRVGTFFDYFGNSTFVGLLSQANTFSVVERNGWIQNKKIQEYEIFASEKAAKNYFSFLNLVRTDADLNHSYFKGIIRKLDDFYKNNQSSTSNTMKQKLVNFDDIVKLAAKSFHGKYVKIKKGVKNA